MKNEWKIGDVYSPELAEQSKTTRRDTMQSVAYSVENGAYVKPLSKEEIADKKSRLSVLAMTLADLEAEKKELVAELKLKAKEPKEEFTDTLRAIKFRQEEKAGTLYNVDNQDEKMMYVFDEDCVCVNVRPLAQAERQSKMKNLTIKTGTND